MPRPQKPPRLYLRVKIGRPNCWVIRHGQKEIATRCLEPAKDEAQAELENYLLSSDNKIQLGRAGASLQNLLSYDPKTGIFTWHSRNGVGEGRLAGWIDRNGYRRIECNGRKCQAHRLAWVFMTGQRPIAEIDHINMVRDDNRWSNLRLATHSQNHANTLGRSDSKSGVKGVSWNKRAKKWMAGITVCGRRIYLGLFDTLELAGAAYGAAAKKHFGEFAHAPERKSKCN